MCAGFHTIEPLNTPCLIPNGNHQFKLCADYKVRVDDELLVIPKNFDTDLASVPRILWWYYSPTDSRTIAPSVLHDYFYSQNIKVNRKYADDVFYYDLLIHGLPKKDSFIFWTAVRLFGWVGFIG